MAKITSPADFVSTSDVTINSATGSLGVIGDLGEGGSVNVFISTAERKIYLDSFGDLSDDGASLQALYSFLKQQ